MTADEIIRAILSDRQLLKIKDKIQSGKGTFEDTAKYSNRASELLGKYFSESVLDISEQERVEACTKLLNDRYDDINTLLDTTQRSIDSKSNLQIKPQHAGFDIDRAVQIGESLIDKTVPDSTIVRRAGSAPVTMSRSMHDDYIKANAEFRSRAGLKCYITRVSDNEPCKWCTRLAGRYEYGQEPDDVYRRHDNCGCTVTYENGRERQNVWTKKKWAVPDKEAGAEPPKVFSKEEAQRLNNEHTSGFVNKMSIDNSVESGIIVEKEELPRKMKSGSNAVDWSIVQSEEYSKKFKKLSDDEKVSSGIETHAKWALNNRDGKNTEELYAVSLKDGREVSRITDQNYKSAVKRTTKFTRELNVADESGEEILLIHNHPIGLPPSIGDINALLKNKNVSGITVGHNGSIYRYTRPNKEISKSNWSIALRRHKKYSDITSMEKALSDLSKEFGFEFEIL